MRNLLIVLGVGIALSLAGCYSSDGPLVVVGDTGYGSSKPKPAVGNIPSGAQHDVCRQQLSAALRELDKARKDLDECKTDRAKDKREFEQKIDKLKHEKELAEKERDTYKKRLRD